MQRRINGILSTVGLCVLILACDSKATFDVYKSMPNKWHKDSLASFNFRAPDTINNYNLYVNLRNTNDYKFNNLYLIVELNYPNGKTVKDTLEYKMAAPNGELLGEGFTDVKENRLWYKGYKTPFKFTEDGDYKVNIQHAMRNNGEVNGIENLEGITDIGFRVEQAQ